MKNKSKEDAYCNYIINLKQKEFEQQLKIEKEMYKSIIELDKIKK